MGQINNSTILKQEAINLSQKSSKRRVIYDAYEINQCLLISSMIDCLSYDLSSASYKISNMTINPLIYDPVTFDLLKKEDEMQMQSKIIYKYEVMRPQLKQTKYKAVTTQTELKQHNEIYEYSSDRKQQLNNHSFGSDIIHNNQFDYHSRSQTDEKPNKRFKQQQQEIFFQEEKNKNNIKYQQPNSMEKTNIFKLEYEETENFSNDEIENPSILSISQNFANLKNHPFPNDEKSYIQNERYWSSSYSSTFIDAPINVGSKSQTQKNLSQNQQQLFNNLDSKAQQKAQNFQDGNQHLTQQQSFGQLKNQALQLQKSKNQQFQNQDKINLQQQQQQYSQQSQQQNQKQLQTQQQIQQQYLYQQQQKQLQQQNQERLSQDSQNNKKLIQNQIFDYPIQNKVQIESSPYQGYTQIHSNKKKNQQSNQFGSVPMKNLSQQQKQRNPYLLTQQFHKSPKQQRQQQRGSPQALNQQSIQSSQGQQQESMRQQFDRLLRKSENSTIKPKNTKNYTEKEINQQGECQNKKQNSPDYYQKLKQNHLKRSQSPVSLQNQQQNLMIKKQQNKDKKLEFTNLNSSPDKQIQTLQDARQNQQQQRNQNKQIHNLHLEELNYKIQDIQKLNLKLDDKNNKLIGSIKQDVSNIQNAITQNISQSDRGLRKKETLENGINLDDLQDYEENSINLEELVSYRGSQEQKISENQNKYQYF